MHNPSRKCATADRDVLVVGASAAGLFAAAQLAERGQRVTVLEAGPAVDPEPRSLIVTTRLLDVAGAEGAASVVNEVSSFDIVAGGQQTTIPLQQPDLIIERARLVKALHARALRTGVEVRTGHRFVQLESRGLPAVVVDIAGEQRVFTARHVIGADGAFSKVARALSHPEQTTGPLLQAIVRLPAGFDERSTKVWFAPEDTPYFYWLIPDAPGRGALGVIGQTGGRTRRILERFLLREGLTPLEYQAARIPIYTGWRRVSHPIGRGVVHLVGDAAGHVKVTTVGGIVTGLRGAAAVAALINDGDRAPLRAARRELDAHLWIRRALHRFDTPDYVRLIGMLNGRARRTLGAVTRDEAFFLALRLAARQPRLLGLGFRGLFASSENLSPAESRSFRPDVDPDPLLPS